MLLLNSTDTLELVTVSAGDIDIISSSMDLQIGTTTVAPHIPSTINVLTAANTTILSSPATGYARNVKGVTICNEAGTSNTVTVNKNDGTYVSMLITCTLLPQEVIALDANGLWHHYDSQGAEYLPSYLPEDVYSGAYTISGALAETINRNIAGVNLAALTSGTLFMQAIWLRKGQKVTNISVCTGTTAGATITNQFFALYDGSRNLLAQSANGTTGALAANTVYTKGMTTPYTIPADGLYYIGVMVSATTVPSLTGITAASNAALRGAAPILCGTSNTGLTTALPSAANAITATVNSIWAAVS